MKSREAKKDIVENLLGAQIQHGPVSERIYLMKLGDADPEVLIERLTEIAQQHGYGKIFAKVPASSAPSFLQYDFCKEASIPGFYHGEEDVLFLARYFSSSRREEPDRAELDALLHMAQSKSNHAEISTNRAATVRKCRPDDVKQMGRIYRDTFDSYPFPIHESDYLKRTMESHVVYFCIESKGKIVALASAEMDEDGENVEMTDFATLEDWRGKGCATQLLFHMEEEMRKKNMKTAYTIARAGSAGMNITFSRLQYHFGGRLVKNTGIAGTIESMNVWYKSLKN